MVETGEVAEVVEEEKHRERDREVGLRHMIVNFL